MIFLSTPERAKYVVEPRNKVVDVRTGAVNPIHGLEARFIGHRFDSVARQRELGWTDEQRRKVEKHLLAHRDFDRPGGIFLELVDGEQKLEVIRSAGHEARLPVTGRTCSAWIRNEAGESEMCPREATHGDLCAQHAGLMEEGDEEGDTYDPSIPSPEGEKVEPEPDPTPAFQLPRVGV